MPLNLTELYLFFGTREFEFEILFSIEPTMSQVKKNI